MLRKCLAVMALSLALASVASAQDAKTVIADATKAMGYTDLKSIEYSGPLAHEGIMMNGLPQMGQWMSPTKGWHQNTIKNFSKHIDFATGTAVRNGVQSRPGDPATGLLPGGAGLDPSAIESTAPVAIAANASYLLKLDITLSPPGFLKLAAASSSATVSKKSMNGKKYTVVSFNSDQKAPSGVLYHLSGYINSQTNMLEKVETAIEDDAVADGGLFGDVVVEQTFSDFKDFNGVKFPTKINQSRAGVPWSDATVENVKVNGPAPAAPAAPAATAGAAGGRGGGGGAAPAGGAPGGGRGAGAPGGGGRGGVPPVPGGAAPAAAAGQAPAGGGRGAGGGGAAAAASPRKIADGIFVITAQYRVVAVEMKDGIVLLDAPPGNIEGTIAQVHQAIPNKPITHIITSHMHFDHVAGLRTALADGAKPITIITHEMNKDVVEQWFKNPHSLNTVTTAVAPVPAAAPAGGGRGGNNAPYVWPDALAKSTKKGPKFQYVKGDKLVLKDATNTIEIYPIKGAVHSEDMMVVYLPKAKAVYQADAWNPTGPGALTTGTGQLAFQKLLKSELDRLGLDYNIVVSGHAPNDGRDATKQDLLAAIGQK